MDSFKSIMFNEFAVEVDIIPRVEEASREKGPRGNVSAKCITS